MTIRTRTFRSGNSQAVRLPMEIAYAQDGLELEVTRHGEAITLRPVVPQTIGALVDFLKTRHHPLPDFDTGGRAEPRSFAKIGFPELAYLDETPQVSPVTKRR